MRSVILSDIAEVAAGQGAPQDPTLFSTIGIPFVRAGSLEFLLKGGREGALEKIEEAVARKFKLRLFPANTILFAKSGMSATLGRIYRLQAPCYVVNHLAAIVASDQVDPSYLAHWFNNNPPSRLIPNESYPSIRLSDISQMKLNLPPLPEQKRIAAILDKADAILRKREKAIELTDSFLRSVFLEMFGDPLQNPKGWKVIKLESAFNEERSGTCCGPFGSALKKHEYVDSGIPVWGIDNVSPNRFIETESLFITPEKYAQLKRYNAIDEDILISRAGTVGRMCVCHPSSLESIIGTNLIRLSLNKQKMLPYYFTSLYTYFASRLPGLRSSGDPDAYSFLNTTKLAELNIPCPPIDIQRDFEQVLIKTRATQVRLVNASAVKETLIASLSSALLKQNASSREVALLEPQQEAHAL